MDESARTVMHDINLASRKAEEAAGRRYQAVRWLESVVGPLDMSRQPSESEFTSCLRNGLVLCNAINKISLGAVPKVVENVSNVQSFSRECQPPPAYQYFENVRNFLVAVQELKLPAFEASDLERDTLEPGSAVKVVDCILALKSYHEAKQMNNVNGFCRHHKSPIAANKPPQTSTVSQSDYCKHLDMPVACQKKSPLEVTNKRLEDSIVNILVQYMLEAKENVDENLLSALHNKSMDPLKLFGKLIASCSQEQETEFPELRSMSDNVLKQTSSCYQLNSTTEDSLGDSECCRVSTKKGNSKHIQILQIQEKELTDLKALLSSMKKEFIDLESQYQRDLKKLGSQVQEMSTAALGYQRVVKENRKLYNMVQDLKGNIRVYCRIRPSFNAERNNVVEFKGEDGSLVILDPSKPLKEGRKVFQFNQVFGPTATQDEVFKDTQPLIRSVMDGYNVCIFAYGQTGSGKTYTMSGPSGGLAKDMGINYLALEDLFEISSRRKDIISYDIHVQMVEIYNEQVRDLLVEDSSNSKLEIRSCASENGFSLPDATMRSVKSTADVLHLMKLGEVNRVVSSTAINNRSSRSHSVVTVHIHGKDASGNILRSCLHLVDLAGSERVDKSEVTGDRLKEAQYINKSLSCLGDVITALAQKNSHIPYRNSKLTLLLQDSLGGHAKTLMFAHVSPEWDSFGETVSTLKFAQRVSTVELGAARANKESNEVLQLKAQIDSLKKALANKEAQKPITVMDRTPPRIRRLSIENGSTVKTEMVLNSDNKNSFAHKEAQKSTALPDQTPPRMQRMIIENGSTTKTEDGSTVKTEKLLNSENKTRPKTPPVTTRARRLSLEGQRPGIKKDSNQFKVPEDVHMALPLDTLSRQRPVQSQQVEAASSHMQIIENGSTLKTEKLLNSENKSRPRTPPVQTRARRLSLEGQKPGIKKDNSNQMKVPEDVHILDTLSRRGPAQCHDLEAASKSYGQFSSTNGNAMMDSYHLKAPKSPTSLSYHKHTLKAEYRTQIPSLQFPKTPELPIARNDVKSMMQSELPASEPQIISGKRSQIRKSLRSTIGKLINGSEKRNQRNLTEARSPPRFATSSSKHDVKSPPRIANAGAGRRQSLTGIPPPMSRRSSLEGQPNQYNSAHENRNAKTPPPQHSESKSAKRWM